MSDRSVKFVSGRRALAWRLLKRATTAPLRELREATEVDTVTKEREGAAPSPRYLGHLHCEHSTAVGRQPGHSGLTGQKKMSIPYSCR